MPSRYYWDSTRAVTGRYVDRVTGRYVAPATVRAAVDAYIDTSGKATATAYADALMQREISVEDWKILMRGHIKDTHLTAVVAAKGGVENMTQSDYGRAGQAIRVQYAYLENFAQGIASGEVRLDGTFKTRAQMYSQAARATYHDANHAAMEDAVGDLPEGSVLAVQSNLGIAEHCDECVALDGRWFDVTSAAYKVVYKVPGRRICRVNCRCTETSRVFTAEEWAKVR